MEIDLGEVQSLPLPREHIAALRLTQQNPRYHAEGNVWNHTLMVLEKFHEYIAAHQLSQEDQEVLYWACLLHDIGKPKVTTWMKNRWISWGHEKAGVPIARDILLQHPEIPLHQRSKILDLVRWHHVPLRWGLKGRRMDAYQALATRTDLRLLGIFGLLDIQGRISEHQEKIIKLVSTFNTDIVPEIEDNMGSYDKIQHQYREASLPTKNLLWDSLESNNIHTISDLLKQDVSSYSYQSKSCFITIGVPRSGKTEYLRTHYREYEYLNLSQLEPILPLPQDAPEPPYAFERMKQLISEKLYQSEGLVIDGRNLHPIWRKKLVNFIRSSGTAVKYLFFERTLSEVLEKNQEYDTPLDEKDVRDAYDYLHMPHPWEAHELEIV